MSDKVDRAAPDWRRNIPRTDHLMRLSEVVEALTRVGETEVKGVISRHQQLAREGSLPVEEVSGAIVRALRNHSALSLTSVINATGVVIHTNLGRAPLSVAAREALQTAAGYVDIEMNLATGQRSSRGSGAREALLQACPAAEDALVVNNGAAALLLAVTAYAKAPRPDAANAHSAQEILVSRGELIEIGAGFRLTDLMESTGAKLREVGTTNRTHLADYARAMGLGTGCILKVHPSNFRVEGFTAEADIASLHELAEQHGVPLVLDLGSGLLTRDQLLPDEPDIDSALRAGADIVIASGDKLLGGPQAGLLLGKREAIARLASHPLARAVRSDKLTLAALEATLRGSDSPVTSAVHADSAALHERTARLAAELGADVVPHDGRVGGGGAPGVPLHGWAIDLPEDVAERLRRGTPAVLARVHRGRCLVDLRCVPERDDAQLLAAITLAYSDHAHGADQLGS